MSNTVNPGTFTRATEATYEDHEGLIRAAKSGQARMVGSRVVENLITASEDMTNAAFTSGNGATVDSATQATYDGTTDGFVGEAITITDDGSGAGGRTFVFSAYVSLVSGTVSTDSDVVLRMSGDAIDNIDQSIGLALTSTPQRFSVSTSTDAAGTGVGAYINVDTAVTLEITKWQLEEVTGQTNQNPSEYVSTGVLSGTYHGLGVDGVKAFSTLNGNTPAIRKFLDLDGVDGTRLTSPTQSVRSTGEYNFVVYARPDDWTPATAQNLFAKWDEDPDNSFLFQILGTGGIRLGGSDDGSTYRGLTSTVAAGGTDGVGKWLRVNLTVDATSGGTAYFYTSDDSPDIEPSEVSWSQLGDAASDAALTSLADTSADFSVGDILFSGAGSDPFAGQIFRACLTGASLTDFIVDFSAEDHTSGSTLTSSSTGEVWTLNGDSLIDNEKTGVVTEATGPSVAQQWMELDGVSGTYASTPDQSTPSELDVAAWVAADDWATIGAEQTIAAQWNTGDDSWMFRIDNDGTLVLRTSSDGTTSVTSNSTAATGFASGSGRWVRVTWSPDTDVSNFYTSEELLGADVSNLSWVQLGSADVAHVDSALHDSSSAIEIGSTDQGINSRLAGKVGRVVVRDTIDGQVRIDFNANDYDAGKTWETQSQKNTTELVPSPGPGYTSTDGWSGNNSDLTVVDGKIRATCTASSVTFTAYPAGLGGSFKAGKRYFATFTTGDIDIGGALYEFQESDGTDLVTPLAANTTYNVSWVSQGLNVRFKSFGNSPKYFEFSSLSVIELPDVWTLNGNANIVGPLARWGDFRGATGDNISTPDSVANSITSDISFAAWAAMDDWTPSSQETIISKWRFTTNERSYAFSVEADGTLELGTSSDGTNATFSKSSVATGFTNGTGHWVGASWDDSADEVTFYVSDDPMRTPYNKIEWTQLGDVVAHSEAGIFDSGATIYVGSTQVSGVEASGKIARAAVIASTDLTATPAADFDARTFTPGVSTAAAPTGETWTINGAGTVSIEQNIPSNWDSDGPLGYLAEESRENILLQSNGFDTTWVNSNTVDTANYAVAPDGTKTAWRLIDSAATGTGSCYIEQTGVTVSSGSNTFSAYCKADQLSWVLLQHIDYDDQGATYFNLATGEIGTINANHSDAGIEAVGNGWYRCWVVFSTTTDLVGTIRLWISDGDGDFTVDRDGTSSVLIWGAQAEAGDFPTSYIPTTTTSVTRNSDRLTYNLASSGNQPATMHSEFVSHDPGGDGQMISWDNGTSAPRYFQTLLDASGGLVRNGTINPGTELADTEVGVIRGVRHSATTTHATNDINVFLDGGNKGSNVSGNITAQSLTTVNVGTRYDGDVELNGTIRKVKIFRKRLDDSLIKNL